jgi:hypothetical protein
MDLDKDGLRDIIASYKGSFTEDTLNGVLFNKNSYSIFMLEWGDPNQSLDIVTSVPEIKPLTIVTPNDYKLEQNFPNPFNPTTTITFDLPIEKSISLKIYNTMGQEVMTLIDHQVFQPGPHNVTWDAIDNNGNQVASGVYIYKLFFGNFTKSKTMTFSK